MAASSIQGWATLILGLAPLPPAGFRSRVSAAISLREALIQLAAAQVPPPPSSASLLRGAGSQITRELRGVYSSASPRSLDWLEDPRTAAQGSRRELLTNRLVWWCPRSRFSALRLSRI